MSSDKRQFPRVNERARLRWRVADDGSLSGVPPIDDGLQLNISGGGISFFAPQDAPTVGTLLAVQLEPPGYPSAIIAIARVVWREPAERDGTLGYELGAEFHWIGWDSSYAQQQIAGYVKARLQQG